MTGHKPAARSGPVTVHAIGRQTNELAGPYYLLATIKRLQLWHMRSVPGAGWAIRHQDVNDLVAAFEADGRTVGVTL